VTARGRRFPRLLGGPTVVHTLLDRGYRPKPYDGRTVLFAAELYASAHAQSHSGWEDLIGSGFVLEPVPAAQHEFMLEPHVGELGRRLRRHLAAAEAGE
jgi:thioesterase domain-containing protein